MRTLIVANLMFWAPLALAQNPPAPADYSGRITVEFYPPGQELPRSNPVQFSFTGKVYKNAFYALPKTPEFAGFTADEQFLMQVVPTFQAAKEVDIVSLYNPSEREEIRRMATDPELFQGNVNFFKNITRSQILTKIYYGTNYVIFMVRHTSSGSPFVKDYPLRKVGSDIYLTNELQKDPVYGYLTTKYAQMLNEQQPASAAK